MFYQCPKCKKVWQYLVEECPNCFVNLERVRNEKIKVIGVSKVNIPTLLHPDVPYFVLVLENEKGNKWVQKSIKEYKIGQEFKIEPKKDKEVVAIWRIKYNILEAMEKAVELIGGLEIDQNSKILILPTLASPKHPYFAENTSPQFLESLIKYLLQKGAKVEKIKVAAQSFDETPIEASAQKSQLLKVCQNFKILPLDLAKTNFIKKEKGGTSFELSEELFTNSLIINLPILKMGEISASKNILKFLKKENYLGLKYLQEEEKIIENLRGILPNCLTLADAQVIQKPDKLTTFFGVILASFNLLNLDRVFFEITNQKDLPEILKRIRIEEVPLVGRKIDEVRYNIGELL
ncbi:MAG: DUF362 domain-containing protein [Candidatus Paceibacterales bacterium]